MFICPFYIDPSPFIWKKTCNYLELYNLHSTCSMCYNFLYFLFHHALSSCVPPTFHIVITCLLLMLQQLRPTAQHMFTVPIPYVFLLVTMMTPHAYLVYKLNL